MIHRDPKTGRRIKGQPCYAECDVLALSTCDAETGKGRCGRLCCPFHGTEIGPDRHACVDHRPKPPEPEKKAT